MSSLVVDTTVLARRALGDLETADDISPALERLRGQPPATGAGGTRTRSLAQRMVTD